MFALRSDRRALLVSLTCVSGLCWGLSLRMAGEHVHGSLGPLFAMWAVMMVGMMVPVEAPSLLRRGPPLAGAAVFLAGYLAPWIAFSLAAAGAQAQLHHGAGALAAPVFLAAGALQFSPFKRACGEAAFEGTLFAGARAGAMSILSCGVLMLIPLVVGMSLVPMALLTLLCVLERVAPREWAVSGIAGAGLAGWGVLILMR